MHCTDQITVCYEDCHQSGPIAQIGNIAWMGNAIPN